jgi:hypothetical protein
MRRMLRHVCLGDGLREHHAAKRVPEAQRSFARGDSAQTADRTPINLRQGPILTSRSRAILQTEGTCRRGDQASN